MTSPATNEYSPEERPSSVHGDPSTLPDEVSTHGLVEREPAETTAPTSQPTLDTDADETDEDDEDPGPDASGNRQF